VGKGEQPPGEHPDEAPPPAKPAGARKTRRGSGPGGDSGSSFGSTGTGSNPFGLEAGSFTPSEEPQPAVVDVDEVAELPPAEPLDWTAERAGYVLRGAGLALHTADPLSREPAGAELWRMTEADLEAMAPPLAAIANRYAPARRLAGFSEEGALAFGMLAYARRHLQTRGRVAGDARKKEPAVEPTWPNRPGVNPDAQDGLSEV